MQNKVEAMMRPYLEYVTKQNTSMRFWKVGALRTKKVLKSQYKRWNNQLHTDYGGEIMKREVNFHPMSMIIALDKFEFLHRNPLDKDDDDNDYDYVDDNDNYDDDVDGDGNGSGDDDEDNYNNYDNNDNDKDNDEDYKAVREQMASNGQNAGKGGRREKGDKGKNNHKYKGGKVGKGKKGDEGEQNDTTAGAEGLE